MPPAGSVAEEAGTTSLHLAVIIAVIAAGIAALVLLLRVLARRRGADRTPGPHAAPAGPARPPAAPSTRFLEAMPPGPGVAPPRRRPAAHHPAGRRAPGTGQQRAVTPPPRRPLQLVAADLRRLTRELSMVPGGTPAARRAGLLAAYDDVLAEAAVLLAVPNALAGQTGAARELERMRLLGQLEAAGLVVTD